MHIYRTNEPMKLHTTFRIGGPADVYAEPESAEELMELISVCEGSGTPYMILGHGSNLLVGTAGSAVP